MKELLNTYYNWIVRLGIILVILSSFFLFTNLTTEFYDTAKFLVLLTVAGILFILITVRFILNNRLTLIRTPLDIPLLLLLAVAAISTFLSPAPYVSLLGNQLKIHPSLTTLTTLVIFYFVLVNSLKGVKEIRVILFISLVSGAVLSIVTLLAYSGVKLLPEPWVHGVDFTPTGSSFSTTAILALLVPLAVSRILTANKPLFLILYSLFLILFGTTIALTGGLSTRIAALVGFGLIFLISDLRNLRDLIFTSPIKLISLFAPVLMVALVLILSLIPPVGGAKNPLYELSQNFPKEIRLGFIPSWKISVSAFRDSPFWGTGAGTYLFNFTSYKPLELNSTDVWNIRFDNPYNEYLQVLASLGALGLLALLATTAVFITYSYPILTNRHAMDEVKTPLAISGLVFFLLLALHSSTLPLWIFGITLIASFMALSVQSDWDSWANVKLASMILTVLSGIVLFAFFFAGRFTLADYHHRLALNAVSKNEGLVAYNELVAAEKLNPYKDLYRADLAQTNFALANAIASAKGPTEASPGGFLTEADKQNIQVLLQQSISAGRVATSLSPRSAQNWEILGLLYRQIAGAAENALAFSLDAYGRAILQDPLNPNLRLTVGGIYYAAANYDLAVRFFTDAVNLKPDFANGYYNLSVALRDKGDLEGAIVVVERILGLVPNDSEDYKKAEELLNSLKEKRGGPDQPPAAQTPGELSGEKLLEIDLPEAPKITIPAPQP